MNIIRNFGNVNHYSFIETLYKVKLDISRQNILKEKLADQCI